MSLPPDSVAKAFWAVRLPRSSICSSRQILLHDISWTAWAVSMKPIGNIDYPLLMTWLHFGGQRSWSQQSMAKASSSTLGRRSPSSNSMIILCYSIFRFTDACLIFCSRFNFFILQCLVRPNCSYCMASMWSTAIQCHAGVQPWWLLNTTIFTHCQQSHILTNNHHILFPALDINAGARLGAIKASHTRYWAFGPQLIPVYTQSAHPAIGQHCTVGQYGYVPLGRQLVIMCCHMTKYWAASLIGQNVVMCLVVSNIWHFRELAVTFWFTYWTSTATLCDVQITCS